MDTNYKPAAFLVEMEAITPMGGVGRDEFYKFQKNVVDIASEVEEIEKKVEDSNVLLTSLGEGIQAEVSRAKGEEKRLDEKIDNKNTSIRYVYHKDTEVKIKPNVMNVWRFVDNLTITFDESGPEDFVKEFLIRFTANASTVLVLPEGINWFEELVIEGGYTYEISILDKLAVFATYK